jgi:hypothetical protein
MTTLSNDRIIIQQGIVRKVEGNGIFRFDLQFWDLVEASETGVKILFQHSLVETEEPHEKHQL